MAEAADQRHGVGDVRAHGRAPVAELLVDEAVAGEADHQRAQQQAHADHPVDLARLAVGAGEVDAHLVQDDRGDHQRSFNNFTTVNNCRCRKAWSFFPN